MTPNTAEFVLDVLFVFSLLLVLYSDLIYIFLLLFLETFCATVLARTPLKKKRDLNLSGNTPAKIKVY